MRHYEVMVILDAGLDEDAIREVVDRATQAITSNGGNVDKVERWGKRRFAYEVHHRSEGYYVLVEATAEPAAVDSVDRVLGLADEVIRHKVIRLPEKAVGKASASPAVTPDPASSGSAPAEVNANG